MTATASARWAGGSSARCWSAIVDADPESFRAAEPDWRPTLPSAEPGRYRLIDLLRAPELETA